jgi:hypothetical protein
MPHLQMKSVQEMSLKIYGMYDLSYAPETNLLTDGWMDGRTDGRQGV